MDAARRLAHGVVMKAHTPEDTHALLAAAVNAGDIDAFAAVYEANAQLIVPPDGVLATGREAIREALRPTFALNAATARIDVVEKLESDGLALTQANWHIAGTDDRGAAVELAGRGAIVSRRQPDGSWLIVLDNPIAPA
jgi:uncharacterized protein (TIGR02246 family)